MWIHNERSFITDAKYETMLKSGCTWICQKCELSNTFVDDQLNHRFDPPTKEKHDGLFSHCTNQTNFLGGLKFICLNINSIRGTKLDLLAFLDVHKLHIVFVLRFYGPVNS